MKITILNGNPEPSNYDQTLAALQTALEDRGNTVQRLDLRHLPLRPCVGCWGCWVKTPGMCTNRDASLEIDEAVIRADFVLWAAPLRMGFPAATLKMALDKHLPLIHPYIVVDQGESHHLKRYAQYPRVGLLVEKETGTDADDLQIIEAIHSRTALNFKTRLEFCLTTETPVEEIAGRICSKGAQALLLPERRSPTQGVTIAPPRSLTLFNGSPRGRKGNTPIFLREFAQGFGGESPMFHLIQLRQMAAHVQAFAEAECAWIGFPLYTDAMPGSVKQFFEALQPLTGRRSNPPLGFLVQSGFPEGLHSRYVEGYLEKLAARLGSPYLGTIVKGNGEGVRLMPPEATRNLFGKLHALGAGLRSDGRLDPATLASLAHPERFPAWMTPLFRIILRLPLVQGYFDGMLKKNGAYERRFDRPFEAQEG